MLDNAGNNSTTLEAYDQEEVNAVLKDRTLYLDGKWNTICLPFDYPVSELKGAEARTLTAASISGTTLTLTFGDPVTTLKAGTPYIIKWESGDDIMDPVFTGVTIDATDRSYDNGESGDDRVRFLGTYKSTKFDGEDMSILLMGKESNLYYPVTGIEI